MNAVNSASTYQETATAIAGTTGTGLDQLISIIGNDPGLQRKVSAADIAEGAMAADSMNALIIEAIRETGIANDAQLSVADVRDINAYLRSHYLNEWSVLHGDDEESGETGFHLVQRDGAMTSLYGRNAVNGVADGLYHLGFEIRNGALLNEDGNANARLSVVADWLNQLLVSDLDNGSLANADIDTVAKATTGTSLDQLVSIINADSGLANRVSTSELFEGASAANAMNSLIVEAIKATGVADDARIDVAEVREINSYLRTHHLDTWQTLHGDDEAGVETGFHTVQSDGATTVLYGRNAINGVADGLYHLGFEISGNRLLNEDGNPNASLRSVADWLNTLLADDLANGTLEAGAEALNISDVSIIGMPGVSSDLFLT